MASLFDPLPLRAVTLANRIVVSPMCQYSADDGSFDNRVRLCVQVVEAIRSVWPDRLPLVVRISATDWVEGGWDIEQSIELVRRACVLAASISSIARVQHIRSAPPGAVRR